MLGRSVQAVCMCSTSQDSCVCKAWVEFGVGDVLGSADKGDQEHDGEVGVQQGRHQQRFHWHPELESRIIIINPIRYNMIFAYFIGIADGSKILPESFGASQQVILQTLTSIQLPLLFFRFPDVRREQLPTICIVQSPPPIYTILSAASALLIHQYSCAICVSWPIQAIFYGTCVCPFGDVNWLAQ